MLPALPPLPPDPAESPVADEDTYAEQLAAMIGKFVTERAQQPPGSVALRDAHAKILGVVRATLRVPADLPAELAHGVFHPGAEYNAWVRFSNGDSALQSDGKRDGRGMAIKLCGVPADRGPRLPGDTEAATQDFVMIDNPVFFVRDAKDYVEFVKLKLGGKSQPELRFVFGAWPPRVRSLINMLAILKQPTNVLAQTFHSMTPYRLGPHVVKVSARPLTPSVARTDDGDSSLRAALEAQLAARSVCFALEVQRRADTGLPVEDATRHWSEDVAPREKVAELVIDKQACGSDPQRAFGDRLSFSPWHGLMAHRPLGSLNRMRRAVYPTSSTARHGINKTPPIEPTGAETF
jgi:hypothetical protein